MTRNLETEIAQISGEQEQLREELQQSTELTAKAQRVLQRRKAHLRSEADKAD